MRDRRGVHPRRVKTAVAVTLVVILASAAPATAATWIGTVHGRIVRANNLLSGGTTWHGDFSLSVGAGGAVTGYAIVGYVPEIDTSGLNNALNYVKTVIGAGYGLLGVFAGPISAVELGTIEGVGVSFGEAMAIRQGSLSGHLDGGSLALRWHFDQRGIPYNILLQVVSGDKSIGTGSASLHNPFDDSGVRVQPNTFVYSREESTSSGGIDQLISTYWIAHRVG